MGITKRQIKYAKYLMYKDQHEGLTEKERNALFDILHKLNIRDFIPYRIWKVLKKYDEPTS